MCSISDLCGEHCTSLPSMIRLIYKGYIASLSNAEYKQFLYVAVIDTGIGQPISRYVVEYRCWDRIVDKQVLVLPNLWLFSQLDHLCIDHWLFVLIICLDVQIAERDRVQ